VFELYVAQRWWETAPLMACYSEEKAIKTTARSLVSLSSSTFHIKVVTTLKPRLYGRKKFRCTSLITIDKSINRGKFVTLNNTMV